MLSSNVTTWPSHLFREYQTARRLGYNHADAVEVIRGVLSGAYRRGKIRRNRERRRRREGREL